VLPHVARVRNRQLMGSTQPPAFGIRSCGDVSLRSIDPSQPPCGGPEHLQLPAKHDKYSFCMTEGVGNPKTQLAGITAGTLREDAKARHQ
jgi:hypothetical protein